MSRSRLATAVGILTLAPLPALAQVQRLVFPTSCGTFFCAAIEGHLGRWVGPSSGTAVARVTSAHTTRAFERTGATRFEWRVLLSSGYGSYCPGVVPFCSSDRDSFGGWLGHDMPTSWFEVETAEFRETTTWIVPDGPIRFTAFDGGGRVVASESIALSTPFVAPEPGTVLLTASGIALLALFRRRTPDAWPGGRASSVEGQAALARRLPRPPSPTAAPTDPRSVRHGFGAPARAREARRASRASRPDSHASVIPSKLGSAWRSR